MNKRHLLALCFTLLMIYLFIQSFEPHHPAPKTLVTEEKSVATIVSMTNISDYVEQNRVEGDEGSSATPPPAIDQTQLIAETAESKSKSLVSTTKRLTSGLGQPLDKSLKSLRKIKVTNLAEILKEYSPITNLSNLSNRSITGSFEGEFELGEGNFIYLFVGLYISSNVYHPNSCMIVESDLHEQRGFFGEQSLRVMRRKNNNDFVIQLNQTHFLQVVYGSENFNEFYLANYYKKIDENNIVFQGSGRMNYVRESHCIY